jgi:hypothetical protein
LQVGLLGSDAVVLDADDVAHLIEQAPAIRHKDSVSTDERMKLTRQRRQR